MRRNWKGQLAVLLAIAIVFETPSFAFAEEIMEEVVETNDTSETNETSETNDVSDMEEPMVGSVNPDILKDQTVNGFTIKNMHIEWYDGKYEPMIQGTIVNNTGKDIVSGKDYLYIDATFSGGRTATMIASYFLPFKNGESINFSSGIDIDLNQLTSIIFRTTDKYSQFIIKAINMETKCPIPGVEVCIDGQKYITKSNGEAIFTFPVSEYSYGKLSVEKKISAVKKGFWGYSSTKRINSDSKNTIELLPDVSNKESIVNLPSLNGSFNMKGPAISVGGNNISLMNTSYKYEMDLQKLLGTSIKVEHDSQKQETKILFGLKTDEIENGYGKAYDNTKNLLQKLDKTKDISKKLDLLQKNKSKGIGLKALGKVDGYFAGYATISDSGKIIESGAYIQLKGEDSFTYRPACTGGVAYGVFKLSAEASGKFRWVLTETNDVKFMATLGITAGVGVAIGVGAECVHLEAGADGELNSEFDFPFKNMYDSISVKAELSVYGEAKFFCFKGKTEKKGTYNLWPTTTKTLALNQPSLMERNYLSNTDVLQEECIGGESGVLLNEENGKIELKSVFEEGYPKLVKQLDGKKILFWINDNGTKDSANRTTLMYAVFQNGVWGNARAVDDTLYGDYYPSAIAAGNKTYVIWNCSEKVLEENVTEEELCKSMGVKMACIDGDHMNISYVTSPNEKMESTPKITEKDGILYAVWLQNSENDPFMYSGTNSIYLSKYENNSWSKAEELCSNLGYISSYDIGVINQKPVVAYTVDIDGDVSTTEDREIYIAGEQNKQLTNDAKEDSYVHIYEDELYWSCNGYICKMDLNDTSKRTGLVIPTASDFKVIGNGVGKAILSLSGGVLKNEIYASYERNSEWTNPIEVTDYGRHIYSFSGILDNNLSLDLVSDSYAVSENNEQMFGETNMVLEQRVAKKNLSVDKILLYSEDEIVPNKEVQFSTSVYNESDCPLSSIKKTLRDINGNTLKEETEQIDLEGGEKKNITLSYLLPNEITKQKVYLSVEPLDFNDSDMTDNSAEAEYGYGDLELSSLSYNENNGTISGTVTNTGYCTMKAGKLDFYKESEENTVYKSIQTPELDINESWNFEEEISVESKEFQNASLGMHILATVSSEDLERSYGNNNGTVLIMPKAVTGLSFAQPEYVMQEKTSINLGLQVAPSDADTKSVTYISEDTNIATVDSEGNVFALNEGKTVIRALTDGNVQSDCSVTVEKAETKISFLVHNMEIQAGSQKQLEVVTALDGEELKWYSDNPVIADVSNEGELQAKKAGTATITIEDVVNGFLDKCVVNVLDVYDTFLMISDSYLNMDIDNEKQLTVYSPNLSQEELGTIDWSSSDSSVATVVNGLVCAKAAGDAIISAKNANNLTAECKIHVQDIPAWTVTFDSKGGSDVMDLTVQNDCLIQDKQDSSKEGFTFGGWYTDNDCEQAWNFDTDKVIEPLTLHAKWVINRTVNNKVNVYFNCGGAEERNPMSIEYKSAIPNPEELKKTGYTFGGWYKEEKFVNQWDFTNDIVEKDTTLYAKWVKNGSESHDPVIPEGTPFISLEADDSGISKVSITKMTYNGSAKKPYVILCEKGTGRLYTPEKDYKVSYKNFTNAYTLKESEEGFNAKKAPSLTIQWKIKGTRKGKKQTFYYTIEPRNLSESVVTPISLEQVLRKGVSQEQKKTVPIVTYGNKKLKDKKDFTIAWPSICKNPGEYNLKIQGIGNYMGEVTIQVLVADKGKLFSRVKVAKLPKKSYTGNPITLTKSELKVMMGKTVLSGDNVDYSATYLNNTNAGIATIILKGTGKYRGIKKVTFPIIGASIKSAKVEGIVNATYDGTAKTQDSIVVKIGNNKIGYQELIKDSDYTVTYLNNRNPGIATVIISGTGKYTGSLKKTFKIKG